jgi:hypothetical protein
MNDFATVGKREVSQLHKEIWGHRRTSKLGDYFIASVARLYALSYGTLLEHSRLSGIALPPAAPWRDRMAHFLRTVS